MSYFHIKLQIILYFQKNSGATKRKSIAGYFKLRVPNPTFKWVTKELKWLAINRKNATKLANKNKT